MFLNLKNKKVVEAMTNQQGKPNQPKSHREEYQERQSKEHKQTKSYRPHYNINSKKQIGSTAISTIQPTNSSFENATHHYVIREESIEKDSISYINKSNEKQNSHRLERVASAYRKIKKFETGDNSRIFEESEKMQDKAKKVSSKNPKLGKKQMLNNIVNNYLCKTEAEENEQKMIEKMESSKLESLQQVLQPFFEIFTSQKAEKSTRLKIRSQSFRDFQFNRSLQKSARNTSKERKKKSNEILIKDTIYQHTKREEGESIHDFMKDVGGKLRKVKEKVDNLSCSKKYKYLQSPSANMLQQFLSDIEDFIYNLYERCLREMDEQLYKFQVNIRKLLVEEELLKKQFSQLQEVLHVEKQKSKMLERMVINFQDKSLYSTIFLNEISFSYDVDSHIRNKLFEEARRNGIISDSEIGSSHMQESIIEENINSEFQQKMHQRQQGNRQNQVLDYKHPFFNKIQTQKQKSNKN